MGSIELFGGVIPGLEKALDIRSKKHNTILSNLANIDTPNYKALHADFIQEFKNAMGEGNNIELEKTHPDHLSARKSYIFESEPGSEMDEGNTVDIDKEMSDLAENTLLYNSLAQITSKRFSGLMNLIKGEK